MLFLGNISIATINLFKSVFFLVKSLPFIFFEDNFSVKIKSFLQFMFNPSTENVILRQTLIK